MKDFLPHFMGIPSGSQWVSVQEIQNFWILAFENVLFYYFALSLAACGPFGDKRGPGLTALPPWAEARKSQKAYLGFDAF